MRTDEQRLRAAYLSLEGLSVGDALGRGRGLGEADWTYSDDTEMAIAIIDVLREHQSIEQDALAAAFARRFIADPERGYGPMAYWLLYQLAEGKDWRVVSREPFKGQGSLGNGAAMRAAPIGAYFSENLGDVAEQAQRSAAITHAHPDGQAGAIAVAVAAAVAREPGHGTERARTMFERVLEYTPDGLTREGIQVAMETRLDSPVDAARALGDGTLIRSSDTVPLCLWCAAKHLDDYEAALETSWAACHSPASDRDTVCAIVGSIVVLATGFESIPAGWHSAREALRL
jgi:ADP-ribosylglycohydrolase